jgi:hypothetical protein
MDIGGVLYVLMHNYSFCKKMKGYIHIPIKTSKMDEIILPKDVAKIIDTCLVETEYGIIVNDIDQFLLNPYIKEGNFIERLHPDIKVTNLNLEEYKLYLEDGGKDNIFDIKYELEYIIYINDFRVGSFWDYNENNILSIHSKENSVAGLIELYEFMKKLKEDNRIPQDAVIGSIIY